MNYTNAYTMRLLQFKKADMFIQKEKKQRTETDRKHTESRQGKRKTGNATGVPGGRNREI